MNQLIYILNVALAVFYLALFVFYARNFLSPHGRTGSLIVWSLPLVLTLHFAKLLIQGLIEGHCPIMGFNETCSFMAFALALIYFVVERYQKFFATGAIFIGITLIFQSVTIFVPSPITYVTPGLNGIPFGLHAPLAIIGIAAVTTSAIYGAIYLIMNFLLKHKHFGPSLRQIPPLEAIEKMQTLSAVIGVTLIAVAIVSGLILGTIYDQKISIGDSKIIASIILIIVFGYGVIGSRFCFFSGKKKSIIAITGFLVALISMTVVRFYLPTFHRF